ncbi:F-box only protein 41-like [Gadus chalcogrammus]|uniref:F-box only protein 41-like n=1 Tax=Gadus chalcogrammus TaxID=1042646 RepID=UPI0024C483D3|nr:F-box only protein 41-like [Gadus chalcogrammus]
MLVAAADQTFSCPGCGSEGTFNSVLDLQDHLVNTHTYQTLLGLSKVRARSSTPGFLLRLPGPTVSQGQSSSLGMESTRDPLPLAGLDLASSTASTQLLRVMLGAAGGSSLGVPQDPSRALALPSPTGLTSTAFLALEDHIGLRRSLGLELGYPPVECFSVGPGLEERLELRLDMQVATAVAELEERVRGRVHHLKAELQEREAELERERRKGERLVREKDEVEERAAYLSRQASIAMEMMEGVKRELKGKEDELAKRKQDMHQVQVFLRDTAEKEAEAKMKLQMFMESLLDRADHAERQLLQIAPGHTHPQRHVHTPIYTHTPGHTHRGVSSPVWGRAGRSLDGSVEDMLGARSPVTMATQRSYSVSGSYRLGDQLYNHHPYNDWAGGNRWVNSYHRYHSTEEEKEEEEDDEDDEEQIWNTPEMIRRTAAPDLSPSSNGCHSTHYLGVETLRLRAGLFCVFPYLDVASLLHAAEVCTDWRCVARHPAVWTRLLLENVTVSTKFLVTLSQWCTQTRSLVLKNLRSRTRRPGESREDYQTLKRGCLEEGVEAVLRSAGGSLLYLSVCQCSNVLTDRSLWLASCYSPNLHTITYRSPGEGVGQEVLWALGAGCRTIAHLKFAPLNPSQQPHRLGNRSLQTIGRCWPDLRSLSVGGAGCGAQGLAAVVRSCVCLLELELECVSKVDLKVATELCNNGLTNLETLTLTHTAITEEAILHFQSKCVNLRSMVVLMMKSHANEGSLEEDSVFRDNLEALKVLTRSPGLCGILQVKEEY